MIYLKFCGDFWTQFRRVDWKYYSDSHQFKGYSSFHVASLKEPIVLLLHSRDLWMEEEAENWSAIIKHCELSFNQELY